MPNVPIPLVGPTYTSRSLPVSAQVTRNFYIEVGQEANTIASFQPFPGLTLWGTAGLGKDRGMFVHNGVLYKISGTELYSLNSSGSETLIGTIPGNNRCFMQSDGANLIITNGVSKPIIYTGSGLTTGTDVDLHTSETVAYINNRVVYDGNGRDLIFADLATPLSVNSANVTSVDITIDDVRAVIAKDQQLIVFTDGSIVPYYNTGTGNPPYDVIQNATRTDVGIKAIHSLARNINFIYFLGSDLMVYRMSGLSIQPIGNPSIGRAIAGYSNPEDAIGACFSFDNQEFYYLTFPTQETWLFSEGAGWTNLSHYEGINNHNSHLINSYANIYNKHLVADRRNGKIYELDFDTYTDNGDTILRQRDTAAISGKSFGVPGKEIFMQRLEIVVETGVGLITGQGSDPKIMMQYSDDGGNTWSSERWGSMGAQGKYNPRKPIEWYDLGSFYQRQFRFKVSDPVKTVFISANADIEVGP